MHLTSEQLTEIEGLASKLFTKREICVICRIEYQEAMASRAFLDAIERPRLLRQVKLYDSILMHAEAGSSPAQTLAIGLLQRLKINEAGE